MTRSALASLTLVAALAGGNPVAAQATRFVATPTQEQLAFFEKKIRPVLVDQCYNCHSAQAEKVKGELLLDTRDGTRKGGLGGAIIVPTAAPFEIPRR